MQIVIVGAGTVGYDLAVQLRLAGHDIGLVEVDESRCEEISERLDILVVPGPGSSPEVLERAGIRGAQIVLAVTSVDEINLLVCAFAAQYGVPTRICRLRSRELTHSPSPIDLSPLGVTRVINPEGIVVRTIDQIARLPEVLEVFGLHAGKVLIARHLMTESMPVVGHSLLEILRTAGADRFLSVVLRRGEESRIPVGNDVIQAGDDVTTLFHRNSLDKYLELLGLAGKRTRKVVVAGDGETAIQLCETLRAWIPNITLVCRNQAHAEYAAQRLDHVEVLFGEPTERQMLHEVNVAGADLFVGAGRDTPQNIMSALLARAEGARKVMAVSFEPQNNRLFREIGVHYVISPRRVVNQEIIDIIHGGRGAIELHLRDMDFRVVEYHVPAGAPITQDALINTWKGLKGRGIVGAVIRENQLIIPGGETRIIPGDHAIVITEPRSIRRIGRLFGES